MISDITVILSTGEENVDTTCTNKQRSKVVIFRDVMICSNAIILEEPAAYLQGRKCCEIPED
jgi:hypothetical protein